MSDFESDLHQLHATVLKQDSAAKNRVNSFSSDPHAELLKARKEQEEITRREFLEKSKQYVIVAKEKEDAFWVGQSEKMKLMNARANLVKNTTNDISNLLEKRCNAFNSQFQLLAKEAQAFAVNERGSLREAAIGFELLRKSTVEEFNQLKERVFQAACTNASNLNSDIAKRVQFLEDTGKDLMNQIVEQRNKVWDSWQVYEKYASESIKLNQSHQPHLEPPSKDPVVLGRVYRAELDRLKSLHMSYSEKMSKLFNDLRLTDGRRIDASKTVLLDYLLAEKQLLQTQLKLTEQAIASVKTIDREKDVNEWVTEGRMVVNTEGATVFELVAPAQDKKALLNLLAREIAFEGSMARQGRIFTSSWTDVHAVLTRSGFFHYFDTPTDTDPAFSLLLSDVTVSIANPKEFGDNVICFSQPNKSFFSLGNPNLYFMQAKSQEQLVDWMVQLKNYTYAPPFIPRRESTSDINTDKVKPPLPPGPKPTSPSIDAAPAVKDSVEAEAPSQVVESSSQVLESSEAIESSVCESKDSVLPEEKSEGVAKSEEGVENTQ